MYGENGGRLRAELATLLRQHRIQQRLGGPGIHTVPESTTPEEREALGDQIGRYRHAVLVWSLLAVRAANPHANLEETTRRSQGPAGELHHRLTAAAEASTAGRPTLEELTTRQEFPMVEIWRQAARAAALGEHDFDSGLNYGHLSDEQCMTVLKDAAEITRGLVGLDRRYQNIQGWEKLKDQGRLGRAAELCATFASNREPDYSVDQRGWRPPAVVLDGPPPPGIAGVLQAEHNLLVRLGHFPDAHSMRLILDSQRIVSHEAAVKARDVAPGLAANWKVRAQTYLALVHETRDVRGLLGNGGPAAAQGAVVATRMEKLDRAEALNLGSLPQLDGLFSRIDARLSEIIEHGASERLYALRVGLPRVIDTSEGPIKPVRERYVPINSPVQTDLLAMVRTQLRPPPVAPRPPPGAGQSRADFEAAIIHRPGGRDAGPAIAL